LGEDIVAREWPGSGIVMVFEVYGIERDRIEKVRDVAAGPAPSGSFDFVTHDGTVLHFAQDDPLV